VATADPFRIRDHVANFDAIVDDIRARSASARRSLAMEANVAYGDGPDETLDLFLPDRPSPRAGIHMFIHGGYWRMFSKEDYSCIAQTVTRAGAVAAVVDYSLMPSVRMEVLVDQVRRAKAFLLAQAPRFSAAPERFSVSGHSAGAHLATFLFDRSRPPSGVTSAFLLGGLYDLKPLQASFLRDEIAITDEEVERFTPMRREHDPGTRVEIFAGALETPPFHEQAEAFGQVLVRQGLRVETGLIAGGDHMSTVRDLAVAGTPAAAALERFLGS